MCISAHCFNLNVEVLFHWGYQIASEMGLYGKPNSLTLIRRLVEIARKMRPGGGTGGPASLS